MRAGSYKNIVGIFALTTIIVLGMLVILFGGSQSIFTKQYPINIKFPSVVVGVQTGQSVTLNGVRVGQTSKIGFWDPNDVRAGIRVVTQIDSEYDIPQGATVNVAASVIGFGKPAIMINVVGLESATPLPRDGTGVVLGNMINPLDQMLPPDMQKNLVGSLEGVRQLSEALKPVAENLNNLLIQRDMQAVDANQAVANIATLVQRFDLSLKNLNVLLADTENVNNIKATLANARVMSERGIEVMTKLDNLGEQGAAMATDATGLIRDMRASVDKLSGALSEINKLAVSMNDTKGTVGLLMNDNRLYEELVLSAKRLSAALDELRAAMEVMKKEGVRLKM
ncbi:MAG: MCE family protein [Planctomycetes bacterium]|nr:MCE family protein [Planctomycetota bacterium]